ncbi:uncharacterized protein HKW66_Vig0181070 [Vigna angularis]|uniref:WRKY domain-containing protein n=1 Tax=Phaseolus angularis TaxID=3914 RepID=A0A8T0K8H1_PHAAN|nr:uncharacterized protein HKW66_Vig0181070 [Vigna angularis]
MQFAAAQQPQHHQVALGKFDSKAIEVDMADESLGRTELPFRGMCRTLVPPPPPSEPRFYCATPPLLTEHPFIPKNGLIETKESSKTINFSYSNSFVSSLTCGDTVISLKMTDIPRDDYSWRKYG